MSAVLSFFSGDNSRRAGLAFALALVALLGAWGFQYIGGIEPCELCFVQRWPYYVGLPVLAVTLLAWRPLAAPPRLFLTALAAVIFAGSTYWGVLHAGIEWRLWPGPSSCTGLGTALDFGALSNIDAARVIPCDEAPIRIFWISLAGYNALVSAVIAGLLIWSGAGQVRRCRPESR